MSSTTPQILNIQEISLFDQILLLIVSWNKIFFYISIFINISSLIIYILEMGTILKNKQFHTPFYWLFFIRAIIDFYSSFGSYAIGRIIAITGGLLYKIYIKFPNWVFALFYFFGLHGFGATNLTTLFMMLTRFTSIMFVLKHKKIWRKLFPLAVISIFILPIFGSYFLFLDTYVLIPIPNEQNMSFFIIPPKEYDKPGPYLYISFYYSIIFLIACAIVNFAVIFAFKLFNKKKNRRIGDRNNNNENDNNHSRIEKSLLIYAFGTLLGHALIAIVTIFLFICPTSHANPALFSLLPIVTDIGTVGLSAWLLLGVSQHFRKEFIKDWKFKFFKNSSNNIINIRSVNIINVRSSNKN